MPSAGQIKRARRLMALSDVQSIRLIAARVTHFPMSREQGRARKAGRPILEVVVSSPKTRGVLTDGNRLRVVIRYSLKAKRDPDKNPIVALDVRATFELLYKLPEDLKPSEGEISAFCNTNALLNSWPYWREFTQSMISRMNLPPLTMPLFRFAPSSQRPSASKESVGARVR
jgi:hypothetical protein